MLDNILWRKFFPISTTIIIFALYMIARCRNNIIRILIIAVIAFLLYFYRLPKVEEIKGEYTIVSPAYGVIKKIRQEGDYWIISIYLNVFDIHTQYVPYDGMVINRKYKKGQFHPAHLFEKSQFNERMLTIIKTDFGDIGVVQIAGMMARRISTFFSRGESVKRGDLLGIIHFGSRVDIILPKNDVILKCKENEIVNGVYSILAEWNF